jgi:hypothetical protein
MRWEIKIAWMKGMRKVRKMIVGTPEMKKALEGLKQ